MIRALTDNWSVLLLRGVFGIAIGLAAFATPALALLSIVTTWALLAEADGIGAILVVFAKARPRTLRPLVWVSALATAAAVAAWLSPATGLTMLAWMLAAWTIARGIVQVVIVFEIRNLVDGQWALIGSGTLSLAFGLAVIARPVDGLLTLAVLFGIYACATGLLEVALALRVRRFRRLNVRLGT